MPYCITLRRHLRDTKAYWILFNDDSFHYQNSRQLIAFTFKTHLISFLLKFDVHSPLVLSLNDDYISSDFPTHSDSRCSHTIL